LKPKSLLTLAELDPKEMDFVLSLSLKLKGARGKPNERPL
jgi:hypothetical protein